MVEDFGKFLLWRGIRFHTFLHLDFSHSMISCRNPCEIFLEHSLDLFHGCFMFHMRKAYLHCVYSFHMLHTNYYDAPEWLLGLMYLNFNRCSPTVFQEAWCPVRPVLFLAVDTATQCAGLSQLHRPACSSSPHAPQVCTSLLQNHIPLFLQLSSCKHACSIAHSCLTLCDPMVCSPPGSTVHGIFQARILEWVAISYSRGSSRPRDWVQIFGITCIGRQILYHCTTWEAPQLSSGPAKLHQLVNTTRCK